MSNNPFHWREYVQPFIAVPVVHDSGHIHKDLYEMVPSDKLKPTAAEIAAERKKAQAKVWKANTRARLLAQQVNPYSDTGRSTGKSNSETAPR